MLRGVRSTTPALRLDTVYYVPNSVCCLPVPSASSKKLTWRNQQIRSLDVFICRIPITSFLWGRTGKKWHMFIETVLHRCFLAPKQKRSRSTELSVACERAWKAMRSLTPSLDCRRGFINRDLPPCAMGRQNYTQYSGWTFPSITSCRRQFLREMWPIKLAFRLLISCKILPCSLTQSNTSSFLTRSIRLIFSILLQHHISKLTTCFWSSPRSTHVSAPYKAI